MEFWIKASQLVLSLSILIFLHELGHFLPARWFKIRVEKFYLFFNPWFSLVKKKIGDTEWGIGWIPLGGYVKIAGMVDESMDKEQMKLPPQPWEFRSKPAWQRLIIMLGGVTVNFLLGFLIYGFVLFNWGEDMLPTENVKYGMYADSFAMELGFQTGDKLVNIDGEKIENFNAIRLEIFKNESKNAEVIRNGENVSFEIPSELTGKLASYKGDFIAPRIPFVIDSVYPEYPAGKTDIKKGDRMLAVNGKAAAFYDEFATEIKKYKNETIDLAVLRGADTVSFPIELGE